MKKFFKPSLVKIVVCIVLLIPTAYISRTDKICNMTPSGVVSCDAIAVSGIGYPTFYGEHFYGDASEMELHLMNLLINLIVIYLAACLIVFPFTKREKKTEDGM